VILETERLSRRCAHWGALLSGESAAIAELLGRKLGETAATREQRLADARQQLPARFAAAPIEEQTAILRVAYELRLDVTNLFPHLPDLHHAWWTEAIQCFTWSRSPSAGPVLAWQANRWLGSRRYRRRVPVILAALRGHPCREAETVLLQAIVGTTAEIRRAAAGSLGWWAPLDPVSVIGALRQARTDPDERTRRAASAALARLGERASLNEHQEELHTEDSAVRLAAINRIAAEEISWLWPEVQALTETDDLETALAATEACEQFRESILGTKR
jgi:HEAT repeat protein